MNCNHYNITKNNQDDIYYLSITDNNTNIMEEMYLNNLEFKVLNIAVQNNSRIINLLSGLEIIQGLFRKGLVTISKDNPRVHVVSDVISCILNPKTAGDLSENIFLEENRPNNIFKVFGDLSICFCCL